ncbi:hypothetical protein ABZ626_04635 [Streptomyces longispororuber]|uniref:hypothetical protein n=1 Tax=Streptomyces longispororuber TaxID=68230 RepID=UPI003407DED7
MDLEKRLPEEPEPVRGSETVPEPAVRGDGCLVVALRLPVRIVVLVLVVPVRIVWDALVVCGRFVYDRALRPVGRAFAWVGRGIGAVLRFLGKAVFVWPWVGLWRYVLKPLGLGLLWLGHLLLVVPAVWVYRWVLTPLGRGLAWLGRVLLVAPARWLYARVLTPLGHGIAWLARGIGAGAAWVLRGVWWVLRGVGLGVWWVVRGVGIAVGTLLRWIFVVPVVALWRWVLAPVGRGIALVAREIGDALGHAWRIAGHVSRAVWGFFVRLFRWTVVEPVRWVYRTVLTPVGHAVRDALWRPVAQGARAVGRAGRQALDAVRESARQARADVRRLLFGASREKEAVTRGTGARREPASGEARTLERKVRRETPPPTRG